MTVDEYISSSRDFNAQFIGEKYLSSKPKTTYFSPSRRYRLETTYYENSGVREDGIRFRHNLMRGIVFRETEELFSINGATCFYSEWLEREADEVYLISTEIYQGYGITNLNTLEYKFYLHPEAVDGQGYIWAGGHLSPDKTKLAIEGCVWAWPYQIKIYDISNPMNLPYPLLLETSTENEYQEVIGWKDNEHFSYKDEKGHEAIVKIRSHT